MLQQVLFLLGVTIGRLMIMILIKNQVMELLAEQ